MAKLPPDFFLRTDVVQIARDLLGKVLVTEFDGLRTTGRITETEAYRAPDDRACHAYGNRRTPRTEVMFAEGGCAYIYLCYGVHHLFNVVTAPEGMAHAVLIRGVEPIEGLEVMLERRRMPRLSPALTTGPGSLSVALGLSTKFTGQRFDAPGSPFWLEDRGHAVQPENIASGPRIGCEFAGEAAHWPWRFWERGSRFVK
ncbi:MAG: DNA-3-methyladenine glycosylase [Saprospiraceae bacterium]